MDDANLDRIPVIVDKSHIITIGEKLYSESIEFIREIVNNAYDADATSVDITVVDDRIEIRDNGSGMDREGLIQYFNIGSQEKLMSPVSPVLGRRRIGQFGIGKFATLAACRRFVVTTRKGDFAARVVFDKESWEKSEGPWSLPLERKPPDCRDGDGTTVELGGLYRKFEIEDLEAKIIEGTPIRSTDFRVMINGRLVTPRSFVGHRMPVLDGTDYGPVSGEVIILPESIAGVGEAGIEIKVRHVTVKRELFGMETWGKVVPRIRGEINADFLSVTSDRTGFIKDSPQYEQFMKVMEKVVRDVRMVLQRMVQKKESRRTSRVLREAISRVSKALAANPELSPFGSLFTGADAHEGGRAACLEKGAASKSMEGGTVGAAGKRKRKRKPAVRQLSPCAVVKKLKVGQFGVSCCIDGFGEDGPEAFTEETTIYINKDHPLYVKEAAKIDSHTLNLARLITQEIALMKDAKHPRQAFDRQSRLLKAAFVDE
jgi:hypothetical protein